MSEEIVRTDTIDGRTVEMRPNVARAVQGLRDRAPVLRANGIFKHPPDWTQEEINFIVDALKEHVPLHTIAKMVHCERHALGRMIENNPELRDLQANKYRDMLEEAEYQADRLVKGGNTAMVIHVLDRLGRNTIWNPQYSDGSENGEGESKIVMGIIPDTEVAAADEEVKKLKAADPAPTMAAMDAKSMAMVQEAVKEGIEAARPDAIEAEAVDVGAPPYEGGGGIGLDGFGMMGGSGQEDPWAAGAESPFAM